MGKKSKKHKKHQHDVWHEARERLTHAFEAVARWVRAGRAGLGRLVGH